MDLNSEKNFNFIVHYKILIINNQTKKQQVLNAFLDLTSSVLL